MLQFKNWVDLFENYTGNLYFDRDKRIWTTSYERNHIGPLEIQAWVGENMISLPNSVQHPDMKKALTILLRQKPELANYNLNFDGHKVEKLKDYVRNFKENAFFIPKFLYHGTSESAWNKISYQGLVPRKISKVNPVYGSNIKEAPKASEDAVYLATYPNDTIRFAGREASKTNDPAVLLKISTQGLPQSRFAPDEDSETNHWRQSMQTSGTLAYRGIIPPENISLYKILIDGRWENPPAEEPQEPDWLVSKVSNINNLPKNRDGIKAGWFKKPFSS